MDTPREVKPWRAVILDPDLRQYAYTEAQAKYFDLVVEHRSYVVVAEVAGVTRQVVEKTIGKLKQRMAADQRRAAIAPRGTAGFDVRSLTTAYDEEGEVKGEWITQGPESQFDPGGEDAGDARDGGGDYKIAGVSTYFGPGGEQRGQWVKTSLDEQRRWERFRKEIEGLRDTLPRAEPVAAPARFDDDLFTVYPWGDPHAGLYAWMAETGASFDLAEFERVNTAAIDDLVARSPASGTALMIDLGDSTHADNNKNRTPGSGHELDVHGRHGEVMRVVMRLKRHQVRRLLEKHRKLVYRQNPGNHDKETALALILAMEMLYENEPRVQIVTSPNPYWYMRFGCNLIGTCHGDGAKGKDLPSIMACDVPQDWADSASGSRVFFVGHVHHRDIKDHRGCTVEYVRTLAAPDIWSHGAGFRSKRTMEAVTYHRTDSELSRISVGMTRINRTH